MRSKLYKLAIWYIGRCNKKWNKNDNSWKLKPLERLTYKNGDKYYLSYGGDNEWQNFGRYDVLDNAIQKLGEYEDDQVSRNSYKKGENMYKVDYYTLALLPNGEIGNVKQYSNTWYTEFAIPLHEDELRNTVDNMKGKNKYVPIITKIEMIDGHCNRG